MGSEFPPGFLWGTSSSSFQVEMGLGEPASGSDWWAWVHDPENIRRGIVSGAFPEDGPGFFRTYAEDLRLAREGLGNNAVRLSVDWSRLFPSPTTSIGVEVERDGDGKVESVDVDEKAMRSLRSQADSLAVKRYREIFTEANKLGLTVLLTLYHWPLPIWVHDPIAMRDYPFTSTRRGWLDQGTIVEYAKFAAFAADAFGDLVDIYATINEAPIVAKYGFLHERVHFPPGLSDLNTFLDSFRNLAVAHGVGYEMVKRWDSRSLTSLGPATVGVVTVLEQYDPADPEDEGDVKAARFNNYLWNEWNLNAVIRGDFDMDLDGVLSSGEGRPDLAKGCDFIGADYYLRETVKKAEKKGDPRFMFDFVPGPGPKSDTGWEIYPEGLRNVLAWAHRTYQRPIYVTENGVSDSRDKMRVNYMISHLKQVHASITKDKVPVRGYFYWSLIDNYSWFSGFRSRFGLYDVDMATKERHATSGVEVYRRIASTNSLPD